MIIVTSKEHSDIIPSSVYESRAPMRFLELSIYSCILSHICDDNPDALPDMVVTISAGRITITTTREWGTPVLACAKECYILQILELPWVVDISDDHYNTIKNKSGGNYVK